MQQMSELMEDRADLVMREQRGLAIDGRRHVAANEAKVQAAVALAARRHAHLEVVHPGTAAFRVTRMPVGVERADVDALLVAHLVEFHFRVPDFNRTGLPRLRADVFRRVLARLDINALAWSDAQVENLLGELKHAAKHAVEREVRAQFLLVEVVLRFALFFAPEGDFPWLKQIGGLMCGVGAEFLQLNGLALERFVHA